SPPRAPAARPGAGPLPTTIPPQIADASLATSTSPPSACDEVPGQDPILTDRSSPFEGRERRRAGGARRRKELSGAGLLTPPPARPEVSPTGPVGPGPIRSDRAGRPSVHPRAGSGDARPTEGPGDLTAMRSKSASGGSPARRRIGSI